MAHVLIEAACDSEAAATAAVREGASRLEICASLRDGGLTPPAALVRAAVALDVPVVAMVRPSPGGFEPDERARAAMERDAARMLDSGAAAIVFGCLTAAGDVNASCARRLVGLAPDGQTVFHRAFDAVRDPAQALETLIALGITRVLTSGGAPTAFDGVARLRALQAQAAGRIEILAGGGVRPENVRAIVEGTGCVQVHCAFAPGRVAALAAQLRLRASDESR